MTECAFNHFRNCAALIEKRCYKCNFCKTKSQIIASRERAKSRINSLPENQKNHIIEKYYQGRQV